MERDIIVVEHLISAIVRAIKRQVTIRGILSLMERLVPIFRMKDLRIVKAGLDVMFLFMRLMLINQVHVRVEKGKEVTRVAVGCGATSITHQEELVLLT